MTDASGFLQAIHDDPDNDDLRLVFADWLEERGNPRGELMRLQVWRGPAAPARGERTQRVRELQARHGREWLGPLHSRLRDWSAVGGLFRVDLDLHDYWAALDAVPLDDPRWLWVDGVKLRAGSLGARAALRRLELPPLAVGLDLSGNHLHIDAAGTLADSRRLTPLRHLALGFNSLGDCSVPVLAASPYLPRLASLDLSRNGLTAAAVTALSGSPYLAELRHLALAGNALGPEGASRLAQSPFVARLTSLNLGETGIDNRAALELARSPYVAKVKALDLRDNAIDAGTAAVVRMRLGERVAITALPDPPPQRYRWTAEEWSMY
jgi:uncharacterized protein (TIGR02996 family)